MLLLKSVRQLPGYCGPASLEMILRYFGIKKSQRELAKLVKGFDPRPGKEVKADALLTAARSFGLDGFIQDESDFSDLRKWVIQKRIPVMVDWFLSDDGHYGVVAHLDKKFIYLQDPSIGKIRKIDLSVFQRVWFDFPGTYLRSPREIIIRRIIVIGPAKKLGLIRPVRYL